MGGGFCGDFGFTLGEQNNQKEELIAELEENGTKFSKEDLIFITRDKTGQIVWLEKGNSMAGLEHILNGNGKTKGHADDFEKAFGVTRDNIPAFLKQVITNGSVVKNELLSIGGRMGYRRVYFYDGKHYLLTGIGTNGFIVTAYPVEL